MTERYAATLRLIVPLYSIVNLTLLASGYDPLPFAETTVDLAVTTLVGILGTLVAWWKNNNVTRAAKEAQTLLDELKRSVSTD